MTTTQKPVTTTEKSHTSEDYSFIIHNVTTEGPKPVEYRHAADKNEKPENPTEHVNQDGKVENKNVEHNQEGHKGQIWQKWEKRKGGQESGHNEVHEGHQEPQTQVGPQTTNQTHENHQEDPNTHESHPELIPDICQYISSGASVNFLTIK